MRYGICGTVNKRYDMTHRHFLRGLLLVLLSVWGMKAESAGLEENGEKSFVHPGIVVTKESVFRMKDYIARRAYPVYEGFLLLKSSPRVGEAYKMNGPYPYISRDHPDYKYTSNGMSSDFSAAYEDALMWVLTDNRMYARKSMDILSAYASTLQGIPESNDRMLLAGLEGFKIASALEILKHTDSGIPGTEIENVVAMLKEHFQRAMDDFYAMPACTNGNWGLIVTKAYMATAILTDDREMYDRAKDFYLNGEDNGTIRNYIDGETGQLQESGRDQQHSMLGLSAMAMVCEVAWHQGDDLYGLLDNRFLKGCEYVARYNLGYDVPYKVWKDVTGKYSNWPVISEKGRGVIRPIFEAPFNHYVHRCGVEMPYTEELLEKFRPEGFNPEGDCGSLLFYEAAPLPAPEGLGHLDEDFGRADATVAGWTAVTSGVELAVDDGCMVVHCAKQSDGSYRGDIKLTGKTLLDGRNWPVFAIKVDGAEPDRIAVDTERGPFGNGYGKWTGRIGDDVYYCDLRTRNFGADNRLGSEDLWELSRFGLKVAGLVNDVYRVAWVKTFRSVEELENFVTGVPSIQTVADVRYDVHGSVLRLWADGALLDLRLYSADGSLCSMLGDRWGKTEIHLPGRGVFVLRWSDNGRRCRSLKVCMGDMR